MTPPQPDHPLPRVVWDDEWQAPPQPSRGRISVAGAFVVTGLIATGIALVTSRPWEPERKVAWVAPATHASAISPDSQPGAVLVPRPMMSREDVWEPDEAIESPRPPRRGAVSLAGFLSINSTPWAELSVDGRVVGTTPQIRIRVKPGRHHLVLVRDGFQTHSAWVDVAAGATVRVTDIALKEIAR